MYMCISEGYVSGAEFSREQVHGMVQGYSATLIHHGVTWREVLECGFVP